MHKLIVAGAFAALALAGCNKPNGQNQNQNQNQFAQNQFSQQGDPYAQNPNNPNPNNTAGWNTNAPVQPYGPPSNQTPYNNTSGGQTLQLTSAPAGMTRVQSPAGNVFRTTLNGTGPIPQQSREFYMKLMPYFDAQPQVMGFLDDPSGRMAQVGFAGTKGGVPVMGMLMVTQGQNGGAVATVLLDTPERFQQSMQAMMPQQGPQQMPGQMPQQMPQ